MLKYFSSEVNNYKQIPAFNSPRIRINSLVSITSTECALCASVACSDVHTKQRQPGQQVSLEEHINAEEIMKMK